MLTDAETESVIQGRWALVFKSGYNARIDHFRIVSIRPGWAHSQRRVGVNITIPSIDRHVNEL